MNNGDMPAMAQSGEAYTDISGWGDAKGRYEDGMGLTKREHFAAMAMQGLAAARFGELDPDYLAESAVMQADSLLKALGESK